MKHLGLVRTAAGLAAVSIFLGTACKTIVEEMPNGPTGGPAPSPSQIPVVVVPVPIPTPTPTPPPAPPPAPAPPQPAPTPGTNPPPAPPPPPPAGGSCSLPPGTGPGVNCPAESPSFQGEVESSINQLIQQRPDIFSGSGSAPFVVKHAEYMNGVVANLRARGLCAIVDSEDEIAVKNSNAFSDQYDILLSTGQVRRAYTATCRPAWF